MNFYPFHIGDYATHTAHLEPLEDLAFRRLLDLYYIRESCLPKDAKECARLIRMRTEIDIVSRILAEFFVEKDDGWHHERCDKEIEKMLDKQVKAQASARASVNARSTNAQRTLSERSTNAELPIPIPIPIPKNKEKKKEKKSIDKPDGVSETVWQDFLEIRKAKKSPITQTALKAIEREAGKAGMTIADALAMCCARGWQGFNAAWVNKPGSMQPQSLSFAERDELAKRKQWEEMTGRKWPSNDFFEAEVTEVNRLEIDYEPAKQSH